VCVCVWDEYKQEEFDLRALLFMIINDWPALSNLLGQTNKGYNACTHCFGDLEAVYLKNVEMSCTLTIVDFLLRTTS
jgi:hypothetical protein